MIHWAAVKGDTIRFCSSEDAQLQHNPLWQHVVVSPLGNKQVYRAQLDILEDGKKVKVARSTPCSMSSSSPECR